MPELSRQFDGLVNEFYEVWFRFHPEAAMQAGVAGYEGRLPAVDDDDAGALGSWLESTLVGLSELDFQALDADRRLDLQLLFGACKLEHQGLLEADWRHRDPLAFLPLPQIHQLVLSAPVTGGQALRDCLQAVPEQLRHARGQLDSMPELIPPFWLEAAVQVGSLGADMLRQLSDSPQLPAEQRLQLGALPAEAAAALVDFVRHLQQVLRAKAIGDPACGRPRYEALLRHRYFLDIDLPQLEDRLEELAAELDAALAGACEAAAGDADPQHWLASLVTRHPLSREERLRHAREQCEQSRAYVEEHELADLPESGRVRVLEQPGCAWPGGCVPDYLPPAYGDSGMVGTLYLDHLDAGLAARMPEALTSLCLRSGWPGRHLQAVAMQTHPAAGSLVRRIHGCTGMATGWALYAEDMMVEAGYPQSPGQTVARLLEQRQRVELARLDLALHTTDLDLETARERLQALPGFSVDQLDGALLQISRRPAEAVAGVVSWRLIHALGRALSGEEDFLLAGFHTRLLGAGVVPLPLAAKRHFGERAWAAARADTGL